MSCSITGKLTLKKKLKRKPKILNRVKTTIFVFFFTIHSSFLVHGLSCLTLKTVEMASKTLRLSYESSTFSVVVRTSDWESSYNKLQRQIEKKTGLAFPKNCYLTIGSQDDHDDNDDDDTKTINSFESLQTRLSELNEKKIPVQICKGQIKTQTDDIEENNQCIVEYKAIGSDKHEKVSFAWCKGDDFDVDDFFDNLSNAIKDEMDFGRLEVDINDIEDVFNSFNVYHCKNDETNLIEEKDDFEELMLDDVNEDDNAKDIYFVLKQV